MLTPVFGDACGLCCVHFGFNQKDASPVSKTGKTRLFQGHPNEPDGAILLAHVLTEGDGNIS